MPHDSRAGGQPGEEEAPEAARDAVPDPEPWEHRPSPSERPRHENAVAEDPDDPGETSAAIAAASWGEIVEVRPGETVDGDFNGAPQLEGLAELSEAEGADSLDAMEGSEAEAMREGEDRRPEETLVDLVADRIEVLAGRIDDARAVGLGALVEAVLGAEPGSAGGPVARDADLLRDLLSRIDAALAQIEARTAELEPGRSRDRR